MQWKLKMVGALTLYSICMSGMVSNAQEWEEDQFNLDDTLWDEEKLMCYDNTTPKPMQVSKKSTQTKRADPLMGTPTNKGSGIFITGSYLFWKAEQDGLAYTIKNHAPIDPTANGAYPSNHAKIEHFDFGWSPGFQVAIGCHIPKRKWDLEIEWTQYKQNTIAHTHANSTEGLFAIWMAPTPLSNNSREPSLCLKSHAKWDLDYTVIDLDLGRYCGISRSFSIRPHGGVRAARIHQKLGVHYIDFPPFPSPLTGWDRVDVKLKNNFLGIGLRAGLDSAWRLWKWCSIFCDTAYSLLWGNYSLTNQEFDTPLGLSSLLQVNFKDHYGTFRSNLECTLGIRSDWMWSRDRYHIAISLGWSEIIWFNQNQLNQLANGGNTVQFFKAHGDLGLSGANVNARFDF